MTAAVWTGAVPGAVMKVICPGGVEPVSILAYLALGWMILVGARPMLGSVDARTAVLIGVGGVIYSIGTGFHHWRTLPFHNAISHRLVSEKPLCDLGRRGIGRNRHHVLCHDILCLHVRTYFSPKQYAPGVSERSANSFSKRSPQICASDCPTIAYPQPVTHPHALRRDLALLFLCPLEA